jgi:hypothetical protein
MDMSRVLWLGRILPGGAMAPWESRLTLARETEIGA